MKDIDANNKKGRSRKQRTEEINPRSVVMVWLLFILFTTIYVVTHAKCRMVVKNRTLEKIEDSAFSMCRKRESINLPESIESIIKSNFYSLVIMTKRKQR